MKKLSLLNVMFALSVICFLFSARVEGRENKSGQADALETYISQSDAAVLVSIYKTEWLPPSQLRPKGKIVNYGRIVKVYKGRFLFGKKIVFSNLIEDAPKWVKKYVRNEEGQLLYLVANFDNSSEKDDTYILNHGSQFTFSYNNKDLTQAFRKKLNL